MHVAHRLPYRRAAAAAAGLPLLLAACGVPRDAGGTTDRASHGTVRVGVIANEPWVTDSAGHVGGIEAAIATELAASVHARPQWVRGTESTLLAALKQRELDLVIGGLTDATPWKQEVAFAKPYYVDTVVVGTAPGQALPKELTGVPVSVELGDAVAAQLRHKGAVTHYVEHLDSVAGAVAAPTWKLASLGRVSSGIVLEQARHTIAAPPGENAWLVRLETLLHAREAGIPALLREARR